VAFAPVGPHFVRRNSTCTNIGFHTSGGGGNHEAKAGAEPQSEGLGEMHVGVEEWVK